MSDNGTFIEKGLIKSNAARKLSGDAWRVLMIFMTKRQLKKVPGRSRDYICTNNGEIVFTYQEAEKHGYSNKQFSRAIRKLVELGFIDIEQYGGQAKGNYNQYAISDRWKRYAKPDFIEKKWTPLYSGRGFTNKNYLQTKSTDRNGLSADKIDRQNTSNLSDKIDSQKSA